MSRFFALALLLPSLVTLTACSSLGSEEIDYRNSEITPTLEIPPDLIQSKENKNLSLPGSKVGMDANTGRYVETGNLNIESRVLPDFDQFKVQGQGDLHWLSIPYAAEKAYPLVRDFWLKEGFKLQVDEPVMGMMKTRWMESKSGSGGFFSRIIERLSAAESKHQYITRLQRSADNAATHIFIAHRLQQQVIRDSDDSDSARGGWQFGPSDPAQEYEMLSRLMLFLGLNDEMVKAKLEKTGTFASRASIRQGAEDEVAYLVVTDGFNQSWNRLTHQLSRLGVTPRESNREGNQGSMVFNTAELFKGLQQSNAPQRADVRVSIEGHGNSDNTRIVIMDDSGSQDRGQQARQILEPFLPLLK